MRDRIGTTGQRNGAAPVLAASLACLMVAGELSAAIHSALVRHGTCPEHGELIHVGDAGEGALRARTALEPSAPARAPVAAVAAGSSAPESHGHDHCAVLVHRRDESVLAERAPGVAVLRPLAIDGRPHAAPRGATFALYLLAPKSSPPA